MSKFGIHHMFRHMVIRYKDILGFRFNCWLCNIASG